MRLDPARFSPVLACTEHVRLIGSRDYATRWLKGPTSLHCLGALTLALHLVSARIVFDTIEHTAVPDAWSDSRPRASQARRELPGKVYARVGSVLWKDSALGTRRVADILGWR